MLLKTRIYQINQQLHDFICDEILGVIQKNISILSFQCEAVQTQKERLWYLLNDDMQSNKQCDSVVEWWFDI